LEVLLHLNALIEKLEQGQALSRAEYLTVLENWRRVKAEDLSGKARAAREARYGRDVYLRGLIEFTNYCKNDCLYCGIRKSSRAARRYRLTPEQILDCCAAGYDLGFRTFVLQGGEDPYNTDAYIEGIVSSIHKKFPGCAITLSLGERPKESYERFFQAGAARYLLRHETADPAHYAKLHPTGMRLETRMRCLYDLREIGYQVGCGFMVGTPFQTAECLADDLYFIQNFSPEMVGIGPFIPHADTPFAKEKAGTLELTLFLLSIIRLILPEALLPATTALGTISPAGREKGVLAGANVIMPNLSPADAREKYLLYDGKICTGEEAAECRYCVQRRVESIGYRIATGRGDHLSFTREGV
jgi:biotin synthase